MHAHAYLDSLSTWMLHVAVTEEGSGGFGLPIGGAPRVEEVADVKQKK